MKSKLTEEELALFSDLFSSADAETSADDPEALHKIVSVSADVPSMLTTILGKAKLTLLAEISHYRLWFPMTLDQDEFGQMAPTLGIPEVVDIRGGERSWRLTDVHDIQVVDDQSNEQIEVLSLSSSGLTCRPLTQSSNQEPRSAHLVLPDGQKISLEYQAVRNENGVMAARITALSEDRELLRRYLFTQHKTIYSHLYDKQDPKGL